MFDNLFSFFDRHQSFVLTTHEPPDADGLGAQLAFAAILRDRGKEYKIINASAIPVIFKFVDHDSVIEILDEKHHAFMEKSAIIVLDTSDEYHIGAMREVLKKAREVFIFDHHEPKPLAKLTGFADPTAASTTELAVELAQAVGLTLDPHTATAVYAGIVYDSGFFGYKKTTVRTFNAALKTIEWGADPHYVYMQLMESATGSALLLQKQALSTLEFHAGRKIAVLALHKEDFTIAGADFEEADGLVNIPLKVKDVEVSILIKEKSTGEVRCSLRSKGKVNVSKIAQGFGGGGHVTASGFRSAMNVEETLKKLLECMEGRVE
ncbi:MAG: bifunctional oligoribonuclease/PAP phosphatase NrnA [Treponema sp.]|jgi:phosphoesterase RecJ-like protein|nr:bifunctional oligoribonuclease/PAP phosphatase NrnA [Treponema sp.]